VTGKLADHLETELIGPVQVVEDEHSGPVDRLEDPIRDRTHDHASGAEGIARMPAIDREEILGARAPGRIATHPDRHLADGGEGDLMILWRHGATVHAHPGRLGLPDGRPDQPRLAKTGLAGQEERASAPLPGLADQLVHELEEVVSAEDDRAKHGAGTSHLASIGADEKASHRTNDR